MKSPVLLKPSERLAEVLVCGCLQKRTYTDGYGLPCPVQRDAEGLLHFGCVEVAAGPFCGERLWIGDSGDIEVIALRSVSHSELWMQGSV
jgi:hypothetical protein